jgi:hypothetical protein
MIAAFGAHDKKRLNRVFDVIGFVYPDYCLPAQKQGRKRKVAISTSTGAPKMKKIKVLTRRPRCIETTDVPKLIERGGNYPLATETASAMPIEAIPDPAREPESEKVAEQPKMLVTALLKLSATTIGTPRKRRMASVLDVVLESVKMPPPTSTETSGGKIDDAREMVTASTSAAYAEAEPLETTLEKLVEESLLEKPTTSSPDAPPESDLNFIVRHALGKQLSVEQVAETKYYAKELKCPQGSLVYGVDNDDNFLYCLPGSKEINVCHEMMDNMGYPKLELGLSAITKDQLADSLAYNNLKVCILWFVILQFVLR